MRGFLRSGGSLAWILIAVVVLMLAVDAILVRSVLEARYRRDLARMVFNDNLELLEDVRGPGALAGLLVRVPGVLVFDKALIGGLEVRQVFEGPVGAAGQANGLDGLLAHALLVPRAEAGAHGLLLGLHGQTGAVSLTVPGALALGRTLPQPQPGDEKIIVINPDFEVIVFRHGPDWRVSAVLARFAERRKVDQTAYHFLLTRVSVEAAVVFGLTAEWILDFLAVHSRTPIPQNVEYSIRDWASKTQVARAFTATLLEVRDPATLDLLMQDPQLKELLVRRISPTVAALKVHSLSSEHIDRMRRLGVVFRK